MVGGIIPGGGSGGGSTGGSGAAPFDVERLRFGVADTVVGDLTVTSGVEWAVPAFALAVPGMILVMALAGQAVIGAIWLAYSRRRLRGLGVRSGARL